MSYDFYLVKRRKTICAELEEINKRLEKAPKGRLTITRRGNQRYYYVVLCDGDNTKKKYINKSNVKLIKALGQKRCDIYEKNELLNELQSIDAYFDVRKKAPKPLEKKLEENEGLKQVVFDKNSTFSDSVKEWLNEPFIPNPKKREHLVVPTNTDIKVRSKSEAMIYNKLLESGLPFVYEKAVKIGGETRYPDFTILDPNTGRVYYYEHFGMLDKPGYIKDFTYKMNLYASNGILLNHNLIVTYETRNIPFDVKQVDEIIEKIKNNEYVNLDED